MMPATVDLPASSQSTTVRQPVRLRTFMSAWGRLLNGYSPLLSIEITRECPLRPWGNRWNQSDSETYNENGIKKVPADKIHFSSSFFRIAAATSGGRRVKR
jgi:hypothetical protein